MQKASTRTTEQRVSTLEVEMLYTNSRIIDVLSDIKKTLRKQDDRFGRMEEDIEKIKLDLSDTRKIVTTMQMAQLEKLQP